ncbi:DUF6602 domain-containing protein [Thermodesulfovibrio yellowstonii]|nr:DUF6602 domain-containing protein [Thermodesulfovibrio islandicus]
MSIFRDYFNSISDILENKFNSIKSIEHSTDKGELCEIFIKEFFDHSLSDIYRVIRGGQIVNIDGLKSKQLDVLLISKNSLRIFNEKGIYPVESVFGVFSITSYLDKRKFLICNEEFESIPKINLKIHTSILSRDKIIEQWKKLVPFKCVFAYNGDINEEWATELNEIVNKNSESKIFLPDIILVNKKAMITKLIEKPTKTSDGKTIETDFFYTRFGDNPESYNFYGAGLEHVLVRLYNLCNWQFFITPEYHEYFNKDMSNS